MKILFICKGSTEIGLGHLIRSRTFAEVASKKHEVAFLVIGSEVTRKLLNGLPFGIKIISNENDIPKYVKEVFDVIVFDMMCLDEQWVLYLKNRAFMCVSISPIFNQMNKMDMLFSRTKYGSNEDDLTGVTKHLGLEYTVIQKDCVRINSHIFRYNLTRKNFPVAICMGGGDAANKTLLFLQSLKECDVPATFWVLIGEGYNHSLDLLINTGNRDKNHEIILAKTNISMWHILNNCVLAILLGGVTTYEAAYAGLPTINMFDSEEQSFLVKELVEAGVGIYAGSVSEENLKKLNEQIEYLYNNKEKILEMHLASRKLIDRKGSERMISIIEKQIILHNPKII